tara:strand:- start:15 stop:419 length:405 start_codon:yes stop_codon:yes gene_type:complete
MIQNIHIVDAIRSLGVDSFSLSGHPTNETEFLSMYEQMTGVDSNNFAIMSSDKSDFSVTWSQVSSKVAELKAAGPLKELREVRNNILSESDWTQNRDVTLSNDADWKTYRQELRDITKTYKSLDTVKWPTEPTS